MVIYCDGGCRPGSARILEESHEFFLFGVHADDGICSTNEELPLRADVKKLSIALRVIVGGEPFAVDPKRVFLATKEPAGGPGRHAKSIAVSAQYAARLLWRPLDHAPPPSLELQALYRWRVSARGRGQPIRLPLVQ